MELSTILSLILAVFGVFGSIFGIYHYFKNPQIEMDKKQALSDERDKNKPTLVDQKDVENKALVLEKQFQWYMDVNNQKFLDLGKRLDDSFLLAANHTKTVDTKVTKLSEEVSSMGNNITRLSTIVELAIQKK